MMIGLLVELRVKPERAVDAAGVLEKLASVARERPGVLAYDIYRDPKLHSVFQLVEMYRDAQTKDDHLTDQRVQQHFGVLQGLLTQAPKLQVFEHVTGWSHR